MNALLIEDNDDEREIYRSFLQGAGFSFIDERMTAKDAISLLCADQKYDLIVLDLKLPDSKPAATFPAISSYAGNIPILVITGNPVCMKSGLETVANGMLCKPFTRAEFIKTAKDAMRSQRYRPLFPVALLINYDLKNDMQHTKLSVA